MLMKILNLIAGLLLVSTSASAQEQPFTINGTFKKKIKQDKIYLEYDGPNGTVVDSSALAEGSFSFKGTIDEPRPARLRFKDEDKKPAGENYLEFFIEPELKIEAQSRLFDSKVIGGPVNLENDALERIYRTPNSGRVVARTSEVRQVSSASGSGAGMRPASSGTVTRRVSESEIPPEIRAQVEALNEKLRQENIGKVKTFIRKNPASFASLNAAVRLLKQSSIPHADFKDLLAVLEPPVKGSNQWKALSNL